MSFSTYLEDRGLRSSMRLQPQEVRYLYNDYQASRPATTGTTALAAPQQGNDESGMGLSDIGGLLKMFTGDGGSGDSEGIGGLLQQFTGGGDSGGDSGGGMGGGSWGGAFGGAMAGVQAGNENYRNDPNMRNKRDGFGTKYRDSRAEVGGAALGGVMGYYGMGALARPAVKAAHPVMEPATRWAINTGDSFGGAGGAMLMDPFGTVASGKYSGEELAWGATLGPAAKWFGII